LEGLDGVLENGLDGLHDTESSLHVVDLWLHSLDGLHLSGDLNEWLSIIESLEDSSGKGFLAVLDGSGLGISFD
jgi:acyl carrier protein